jgi:hypothetical protein
MDSALKGVGSLGMIAGGGGGEVIVTAGADGIGAGMETAAFFLHPETDRMGRISRRTHNNFRFRIPIILTTQKVDSSLSEFNRNRRSMHYEYKRFPARNPRIEEQ